MLAKGNNRIGAIDALRGVTLLFILLVHSTAYFGYVNDQIGNTTIITNVGHYLAATVNWLLQGRANKIFSLLFGCSFYLILRKPDYPSIKFVWRCVLLAAFGLIHQLFSYNDVLLSYGLMGIILTLFRRCKPKALLLAFACVSFVGIFISKYGSLSYISSCLIFLSYFILGYCIAVMGILENLKKYSILRNVVILFIINVVFLTISWLIKDASSLSLLKTFIKALIDFFGSFFFIILFLFIYFSCNCMTALFKYLESYGRLGLTNYIFQSVFGIIITLCVIIPFKISFEYALVIYLLIYAFQMWFSTYWLQTFKNGPLEWLWRCLTNMKFSNPLIDKQ